MSLPVHKCLVENVVCQRVVDFGDEGGLHTAEIHRTVVVGVARERLVKVLLLVKLVEKPNPHCDGEAVLGWRVVALDGRRIHRIARNLPLKGVVAVPIHDGQRGLPLDLVLQRRRETLAQRRVDERGVVRESGDCHGLRPRIDGAAGEGDGHTASGKKQDSE